jgi:hypothetical protein
MRKLSLALATTALFTGAFFFSFSSDSNGGLHFFKKANAKGLTWQLYDIPCPGSEGVILICGPGPNSTCFPIGSCPGQ